jgi:hypothetical protein
VWPALYDEGGTYACVWTPAAWMHDACPEAGGTDQPKPGPEKRLPCSVLVLRAVLDGGPVIRAADPGFGVWAEFFVFWLFFGKKYPFGP